MTLTTIKEITEKYNELLNDSFKFNYLLRDTDLQKEQIVILSEFRDKVKSIKYNFINEKDELLSNLFFHFQCVLNSLITNFQIWIEIKETNYKDAWDRLVDAQEYLEVAFRIEGDHYGIDKLYENLQDIEKLIFPGYPLYHSVGFVEKGGKCSICNKKYSDCNHLEDFIYMGKLCRKIDRQFVEFNHSALVKNPYDRRCTIQWISDDDGKKRDYITWKKYDDNVKGENGGMTMGIVLFNMNVLDFD